jgi:ornithine cyclodeaminase
MAEQHEAPPTPVILDAQAVAAALPMPTAIQAIQEALKSGLDPTADPPRSVVTVDHGQLLLMPSQWGDHVGIKVATVAPNNPAQGRPRIQGNYLLLDGHTLTPVALLDAVTLTAIRTAAVSAVATDHLAERNATALVIFGTGPQAQSHLTALRTIRPINEVTVIGRDPTKTEEFAAANEARVGQPTDVATADIVACCTTSRTPLFDGQLLQQHATVVAVGSHEPTAAEVDATTITRSTIVVETRETALREAGDIIQQVTTGQLDPTTLIELATLIHENIRPTGPRLFKSVGMAWQDLVLAAKATTSHP